MLSVGVVSIFNGEQVLTHMLLRLLPTVALFHPSSGAPTSVLPDLEFAAETGRADGAETCRNRMHRGRLHPILSAFSESLDAGEWGMHLHVFDPRLRPPSARIPC